MKTILIFLVLCSQASGAYAHYWKLTVDSTKCGFADSTAVPVLVNVTDDTLKTSGAGGHVRNSTTQASPLAVTMPADLVFATDTAGSSKVPWEVLKYDSTAGTLLAYFSGTCNHTTNQIYYMAFDDSGVTTAQNTSANAPTAVWANFTAVYHFESSNITTDSTGNGHTLTNNNSVGNVSGQIGQGVSFNGSNQSLSASVAVPSTFAGNLEFWVNINASNGGWMAGHTAAGDSSIGGDFAPGMACQAGKTNYSASSAPDAGTGVWQQLTCLFLNSTSRTAFGNGVTGTTDTTAQTVINTNTLVIGAVMVSSISHWGQALIDEFRLSDPSSGFINQSWVTANYNTQSSPGTVGSPGFLIYASDSAPTPTVRHRVVAGQ